MVESFNMVNRFAAVTNIVVDMFLFILAKKLEQQVSFYDPRERRIKYGNVWWNLKTFKTHFNLHEFSCNAHLKSLLVDSSIMIRIDI